MSVEYEKSSLASLERTFGPPGSSPSARPSRPPTSTPDERYQRSDRRIAELSLMLGEGKPSFRLFSLILGCISILATSANMSRSAAWPNGKASDYDSDPRSSSRIILSIRKLWVRTPSWSSFWDSRGMGQFLCTFWTAGELQRP